MRQRRKIQAHRIRVDDLDVGIARSGVSKERDEACVYLDGRDARAGAGERRGKGSDTGADFQDVIVGADLGRIEQSLEDAAADQKMLAGRRPQTQPERGKCRANSTRRRQIELGGLSRSYERLR